MFDEAQTVFRKRGGMIDTLTSNFFDVVCRVGNQWLSTRWDILFTECLFDININSELISESWMFKFNPLF